jgi:hypothetical protein
LVNYKMKQNLFDKRALIYLACWFRNWVSLSRELVNMVG